MLETEVLRKSRHSGCLYTRVPLFWLSCQLEFHIRTRDGFTFVLSRDSFVSEGLWWFRTSLRVFFLICVLPWSSVDSSTIECFIAWSKYRSFTFLLNFVFNFFFFLQMTPSSLLFLFMCFDTGSHCVAPTPDCAEFTGMHLPNSGAHLDFLLC